MAEILPLLAFVSWVLMMTFLPDKIAHALNAVLGLFVFAATGNWLMGLYALWATQAFANQIGKEKRSAYDLP